MVLCGSINKEIASRINAKTGVQGAVGLSGLDANIIQAVQKDVRFGLVGEPIEVNSDFIKKLVCHCLASILTNILFFVNG